MAENYSGESEAATMKPRLLPTDALMPRDDSGGPGFDCYSAEFGDGGRVTGAKSYLSAGGKGDGGERREKRDRRDDRKY